MVHKTVVVFLQLCLLMTIVASKSGFTNPNVTLICSDNTIHLVWNPVHEDYDTIEEMEREYLEYCTADIHCDSGYSDKDYDLGCSLDETVSNYGNGTWEVDFPLINTEYYCTVLIEIRDHYDYSDEKTRTKAECNFEIAPYDVNIRGDHSYNHGDQLVLNCSSEGSPNLEYTWLSPGNVTISTNTSTLIIYNITGSDGGEYTCNVTNNFGTDSNTITVHIAPFNVNIMGEKLHSQGEQLQLNCLSDGGPVLEYTWLHSSNIIPNANTNILIINNVNTTHGGEYICNVTNNAGYDSKHITVYIAPYDVDTKGNISYSQGDQLALNCTSEGGPQLEYSWVHLGDVISNVSTLIIDNMDTTHGGEYICNVANDAGNDSKNITVYITPPPTNAIKPEVIILTSVAATLLSAFVIIICVVIALYKAWEREDSAAPCVLESKDYYPYISKEELSTCENCEGYNEIFESSKLSLDQKKDSSKIISETCSSIDVMLKELNGQCENGDITFNSAVDLSSGCSTMHDEDIDSHVSSGDYVGQDIAANSFIQKVGTANGGTVNAAVHPVPCDGYVKETIFVADMAS